MYRFDLKFINPDAQYWRTTISRWAKDLRSVKTDVRTRPLNYDVGIDNEC